MHELSIATEIISLVEKEIENRNLKNLTEIHLRIGALAGIDPEALKFGFNMAAEGTNLAQTSLEIEWVAVQGKCRSCGRTFEVPDFVFSCPRCDSVDIEVTAGEELDIVSLTEE